MSAADERQGAAESDATRATVHNERAEGGAAAASATSAAAKRVPDHQRPPSALLSAPDEATGSRGEVDEVVQMIATTLAMGCMAGCDWTGHREQAEEIIAERDAARRAESDALTRELRLRLQSAEQMLSEARRRVCEAEEALDAHLEDTRIARTEPDA